jgi:hypothetical protein
MVKGLVIFLLDNNDVLVPDNEAFVRMELVADYRIFSQLANLRGEIPEGGVMITGLPSITATYIPHGILFGLLENGEIVRRNVDGNGKPLTFVRSHDLLRLHVPADTDGRNKNLIDMCHEFDGGTPVVLYWI